MNGKMKEIASLPSERKMWILRKHYAGNGGVLPPTDPRLLAMTPEQIDLDIHHILLDKEEQGGGDVFMDDEYEREMEEEERMEREQRIREKGMNPSEVYKKASKDNEDDWEDVDPEDFDEVND